MGTNDTSATQLRALDEWVSSDLPAGAVARRYGRTSHWLMWAAMKYGVRKGHTRTRMPDAMRPSEVDQAVKLYRDGRTVKEVATVLGRTEATVSKHLRLAGIHIAQRYERLRGTGRGRVATRKACRLKYRKERAKKEGRQYIPQIERVRIAAEKRAAPRKPRPEGKDAAMMRRYLADHPEVDRALLSDKALRYRARYAYDDTFRAKELERLHRKKTRSMRSDGTLDSAAVGRLFGEARSCLYCGARMRSADKTLDHIEPRSRGGWHSVRNVVVCCKKCNAAKQARSPIQWLRRVPPERRDLVKTRLERVLGYPLEQPPLGVAA